MSEIEIGRNKPGRRSYGFDDVAVVPSRRTRDPEDVSTTWQVVDESLEVQRLPVGGDVLGRDGGAADEEQVHARIDHGLPMVLGALRGQGPGGGHYGIALLADALADQLGLVRCGYDRVNLVDDH